MVFPFELSVDLSTLAILALVAFFAGFIDAIAGGGGLLTIPALLTAGLPPHLALGTNKLSRPLARPLPVITFYRRKLLPSTAMAQCLVGTPSAPLGGGHVRIGCPRHGLTRCCLRWSSLAAVPVVWQNPAAPLQRRTDRQGRQWPQGLSLGFYDGVAGPGTGAFWTVSSSAALPARSGQGQRRGAQHELRQQSLRTAACLSSAGRWPGSRPEHGLGADGRRVSRRAHGNQGRLKFIRPVFILWCWLDRRLAWQHWFALA